MAHALRAWAINRGGKNSVRNLLYGPRTRLVRRIYMVYMRLVSLASIFILVFIFRGVDSSCQEIINEATEAPAFLMGL